MEERTLTEYEQLLTKQEFVRPFYVPAILECLGCCHYIKLTNDYLRLQCVTHTRPTALSPPCEELYAGGRKSANNPPCTTA